MAVWTREIKRRFNPQVEVQYDCTSEASDEEWQEDTRDENASSEDPIDRAQQKAVVRSRLLPGHSTLLNTQTRRDGKNGLKTPKLHRSPVPDGITARLIR